jgi:chromosome segregation ATPase
MIRLLVPIVCGALLFPVGAQAQTSDVLGELLKEVRALRIAMERAATVGARIQLLVARVQLQEQRIAELSRRAAVVRDELSKVDAAIVATSAEVKRFDGYLERGVPAEDRGQIERQLEIFKAQLAVTEKRRQDLANEEALLSQQISADQGRWTDVNNQLDQLERSLTPPKQ